MSEIYVKSSTSICFFNDHLHDPLYALKPELHQLDEKHSDYIIIISIFHAAICISKTQQRCCTMCQNSAMVRNLQKHEPS